MRWSYCSISCVICSIWSDSFSSVPSWDTAKNRFRLFAQFSQIFQLTFVKFRRHEVIERLPVPSIPRRNADWPSANVLQSRRRKMKIDKNFPQPSFSLVAQWMRQKWRSISERRREENSFLANYSEMNFEPESFTVANDESSKMLVSGLRLLFNSRLQSLMLLFECKCRSSSEFSMTLWNSRTFSFRLLMFRDVISLHRVEWRLP